MLSVLILAHLVGDFVLQTRGLVQRRHTPAGLAIHTGLVGLAMVVLAWPWLDQWWPWLLAIMVSHSAIDWLKMRLTPRLSWPPIVLFLADQAAHALVIGLVTAGAASLGEPWWNPNPMWWIASVYVLATYVLSVALPLWLDPAGFMQRPVTARLTLIVSAAVALTLAWRGLALLVPLVGLGLHQGVARRLMGGPVKASFGVELWATILMSATLGWSLT